MKNTDVDSHWCLAPKRLLSYQSVVHLPRETVRAGGIQQQSPPLHFKQASEKVAASFEQLQPYNEKLSGQSTSLVRSFWVQGENEHDI